MSLEKVDHRGEISIPAEQRRPRLWEVARQAGESLPLPVQEVGGRDLQAVGRDGEDLEGAADVLEFELPQTHETELRLILDLIVDGVRYEDPPGDTEGFDA